MKALLNFLAMLLAGSVLAGTATFSSLHVTQLVIGVPGTLSLTFSVIPSVEVGATTNISVTGVNFDIADTEVLWDVRGEQPSFGANRTLAPTLPGVKQIEVEAMFIDGRRLFAATNFFVWQTANREIENFTPGPATNDAVRLWFALDGSYTATKGSGTLTPSGTPTFDSTSFHWPSRPSGQCLACADYTDTVSVAATNFYLGTRTNVTLEGMIYRTATVDAWQSAYPIYAEVSDWQAYMGLRQWSGSSGLLVTVPNGGNNILVSVADVTTWLTLNEWHHVRFQVDGTGYKAWFDGVLRGTYADVSALSYWNGSTLIEAGGVKGYVDEVLVKATP